MSELRRKHCSTLEVSRNNLGFGLEDPRLKPILEQNETELLARERPRKPVSFMDTLVRNHAHKVNFANLKNNEQSKDVGWGASNGSLVLRQDVRALPDMKHIRWWDNEKAQQFIRLTGQHAWQQDKAFGISLEDLDGISIRQQKEIIKNRVR